MRHCTVCGAEAREGAKFCTSCGARLADLAAAEPAAASTQVSSDPADTRAQAATVPAASDTGDEPDPGASVSAAEAASGAEREEPDTASEDREQYVPSGEEATLEAERSPEYTSSWPASDTAGSGEAMDTSTGDDREIEDAWSWQSTGDDTPEQVTAAASSSFTTDTDQDPGVRDEDRPGWDRDVAETPDETPVSSEATPGGFEAAEDEPAATDDDDHHGASQWESWAPVATGASAVASADASREGRDDPAREMRSLLNELANRIDRYITPATMASRAVDPDDLADQLGRWSRAMPNTDVLLEVVQSVRKSPRDLDAVTRLSDHAADLELLVRHYQSITSGSDRWATALRHERGDIGTGELD